MEAYLVSNGKRLRRTNAFYCLNVQSAIPMPSPLRPETPEAQRQGWLGSIQLIRPVSLAVLTAFVTTTAVLVGAYLSMSDYTRKARVSGYLVPDRGVIRLVAPQNATVLERHVVEGQAVQQGDVLFVLSIEEAAASSSTKPEAQARLVIRAPQDGLVTAVLAERGQLAMPSTALANMVPSDARLQAHLFAPSSAVGFVHSDQPVRLRLQAYPFQKFGHQAGRVLQVSRMPLQAAELPGLAVPAGNAGEPLYRITVALDRQAVLAEGQAQPLVAGMQLDADVLLDKRRLIEWIFEPMVNIAGRV